MALKAQQRRSTEERTALWQRRWVQIIGAVVLIVLACLVIETVIGSGGPPKATSSSHGASVSDHQVAAPAAGDAAVGETEGARLGEGFGSLEPGANGATRPGPSSSPRTTEEATAARR